MERILNTINNYFYIRRDYGDYTIKDGNLQTDKKYLESMYIEVVGSMANDGIYRIESVGDNELILDKQLIDEEFTGTVLLMKVPNELERIKLKIEEYEANNKITTITSESFGGSYSYTKATNKNGEVATWQDLFNSELKAYRNIISKEGQIRRLR